MDDGRFDDLTRNLARGQSRRAVLKVAAAGVLGILGLRDTGSAQVSQAQCGNVVCASNLGVCKPGCVCCVYSNGNSRCRPPGTCSGGTEVVPTTPPPTTTTPPTPTTPVPNTTSTATPATTTLQPTTTIAPTSTTQAPTTPTPTTTPQPTTTATPTTAAPTTTTTTAPPGACIAGDPTSCTPPTQCQQAGVCNPETGQCTYAAKPDGTVCDDGNACTIGDSCQGGVCQGAQLICFNSDPCLTAVCDSTVGCTTVPKPTGTSCADFSPCDGGEVCDGAGSCIEGAPIQCDACNACDPATGTCKPANNGGSCPGDGNRCFGAFACANGVCVGVQPVVCAGSGPCFDPGTCNSATGQCSAPVAKANGASCVPGNLCIQGATCQNGTCTGGTASVCEQPTQLCHDAICDPATGACVNTPLNFGARDTKGCDVCLACFDGECGGGVQTLDCGSPCLTCDPSLGACIAKPVGADCGSTCTQRATCRVDGVCVLTQNTDGCFDFDVCSATVCNDATGQCEETGAKDGQACGGDICKECRGGQCVPKTCSSCEQCNPATGFCVPCDRCCQGRCDSEACGAPNSCCSGSKACCDAGGGDVACVEQNTICEGVCFFNGVTCCGRRSDGSIKTCGVGEECCSSGPECCPTGRACCSTGCCQLGQVCGAFGCQAE